MLVIAPHYRTFIKDQIEAFSPYFREINVIVIYNPLFSFGGRLFKYLKKYQKTNLLNKINKPNNVHLFFSTVYDLPIYSIYKRSDIAYYKSVLKCINKNNIEFNLVYAHFIWPSGCAGVKLAKKNGVPSILIGHGYDVYTLPFINNNWKNLIVAILDCADHIITVSNKNKNILKSMNIMTSITVIPNGYNKNLFYPMNQNQCRTRLNIPLNKKMLLAIGNLVEIKGHKYLIESLKILKNIRSDFICYIVGEGILKALLQKQLQKNKLNDHIKLVGWVAHENIPKWINAADLLVLPSLNEGNPTVMFEALGCGKPFIASNVGGIPEIIISEDYGLLCNPADSKGLGENIMLALERKWDQEKIVKYAQQYDWNNITNKTVKILSKLLDTG